MKLNCPRCDEPIDLPAAMKSRPLQPVDGPHAVYVEIDAAPLRRHLIAKHSGPDGGGGGEPLPIPRSA